MRSCCSFVTLQHFGSYGRSYNSLMRRDVILAFSKVEEIEAAARSVLEAASGLDWHFQSHGPCLFQLALSGKVP